MFNNLNNQNTPQGGPVDDIFAETDRADVGANREDIETHKVGLASSGVNVAAPHLEGSQRSTTSTGDEMTSQMLRADQEIPRSSGKGYLKIILIVLGVIGLSAVAYFAYFSLMSDSRIEDPLVSNVVDNAPASPVAPDLENNFVEVIPEEIAETINEGTVENEATSTDQQNIDSGDIQETPGVSNVGVVENDFESFTDSDGDGLSDDEEIALRTNPNLIDSDNDGLSDYEEVKIYLSNPLSADTDGDGYLDGEEVKAGYDPNVVGAKLPGNNFE